MKKNVVAMLIVVFAFVEFPVLPSHASTIDSPRIEVRIVNTSRDQQIINLVGVNAEGLSALDFEVGVDRTVAVTDLLSYCGETTMGIGWSTESERVLKFSWRGSGSTHHEEPLISLRIANCAKVSTAEMFIHVSGCVVDGYRVQGSDTTHKILFSIPPDESSAPTIQIVDASDSNVCVRANADEGDIVIIATCNEAGKMLSTQTRSVSEMPIDGKGYRVWSTHYDQHGTTAVRVMLVDKNFCPRCEPDEAIISHEQAS